MKRTCRNVAVSAAAVGLFFAWGSLGLAEVVRVQVDRREPFAQGHAFGRSGPYDRISGRLHLEVDPDQVANERITDLKLAPRNDRGRVEFWTDFDLLMPADPKQGNGRLIFGVNNRGNKLLLGAFNNRGGNDPKTLADAGNGFLMRQGYTILWCGWNGDVLPGDNRLVMGLPVAQQDGRTITGRLYAEIIVDDEQIQSQPFYLGSSNVYPSVSLDNAGATLTMRPDRSKPAVEIPRDRWAFGRWENGKLVPDPGHLYLTEGFRPGWIYELLYTSQDPRVIGLGFAAVRDSVSFFRYAAEDSRGQANPLAGAIQRAYVFGISQSGRFIHHFIYEGFNGDERGRAVFEAALPHVAGGGKGSFNHRFAQTTRYGSQHEENLYPTDVFPFTSVPQKDPVTGQEGDMLSQARARGPVPKIFFTQTSAEYWSRAASLLHTDVEGTRDLPLAPEVRIYFIAGAQHIVSGSPSPGMYQYQRNILDHRPALRALLVALDRWVSLGEEPPESVYPKIADGTLVDLPTYRTMFPPIPEVKLPQVMNRPLRLDAGPRYWSEGIADHVPPKAGPPYGALIPAVDEDGNAVAGIRLPEISVPLATYTGWNVRAAKHGAEGMLSRFIGAYFPLPPTPEHRRQTGDPRRSVLERYPTQQAYLDQVAQAAQALREKRLLLEEDVEAIRRKAAAEFLASGGSASSSFFVANNGNDAWSGTRAAPNAPGDDGPFASLARARDAIGALKAAGPLAEAVRVQIRGGVYYLTDTVTFGPEDSGAEGAVISYEAYPGETPAFVGGRRIEGWQPATGRMLSVHLPGVQAGDWYFRQLFVDGQRQVRARSPNVDPADPIRRGFLYTAPSQGGFGLAVNNIHNPGDWTEYRVQIPADGEYVFWVYYGALNAPHGRTDMSERTTLTVDQGQPILLADLPDTGSWAASRWSRAAAVRLQRGERVLRWQNVQGGGLTLDAFALCDAPDWTPRGKTLPGIASGKHLVVFQAEAFAASHGRQLSIGGTGGSKTEFHYGPGEFKAAWAQAPDAELHIFQSGSCRAFKEILAIKAVDEQTRTVTVTGPEAVADLHTGDRYFVENLFEELDAPGEWYLHRATGVLTFIPPDGFGDASEVVAPTVGRIIEVAGASHLRFAGLRLRNSDYTPEDGCGGYGMGNNGTVYLGEAHHCVLEGCAVTHTGRYAVCISGGGDHVVRRNDFAHSAQGGVLILSSAGNEVLDNHIHDCGAIYKHVGGVVLQGKGTDDNRIAHNHIHRISRYGITLKSAGLRNIIEFNRVHETNLETYDTGGIEVTQHDRELRSGSAIRHNIVGDSVGWYAQGPDKDVQMSWGIYLDSFAGGYTVTNNITFRNSHGGIMLQGGQGNTVVNNIFVDSTIAQGYFPNFQDNSTGQTLERNIFSYADPEALLFAGGKLTPEVLRADRNLYDCPAMETPRMRVRGIASFAQWQERGFDRNSVIADPRFVAPERDDYSLRPESPAFALGFQAIDTRRIGLLTPR